MAGGVLIRYAESRDAYKTDQCSSQIVRMAQPQQAEPWALATDGTGDAPAVPVRLPRTRPRAEIAARISER